MRKILKLKAIFCILIVFVFISVNSCDYNSPASTNKEKGGNISGIMSGESESAMNAGNEVNHVATIKFAGSGGQIEQDLWDRMIKSFNEQHKDIKVEDYFITGDWVSKTNTMLATGIAPDVVQINDNDFGRWVKSGVLLPIQSYLDKDNYDLSDYYESAINRYRWDGKRLGKGDLYCLPKDISPVVLYYNKDLFDKAGIQYPDPDKPMTFEEFLNKAEKLTLKKDGKIVQYGAGPAWWEPFVWSNGGKVLSDDCTQFLMNSPEAVEALQFCADLRNKYHVAPDTRAIQVMSDIDMFKAGETAMSIGGRWMVPQYRQLGFKWDVCMLPVGRTGKPEGYSCSLGYGLAKNSRNPSAAYEFIKFLGGVEGDKIMHEIGYSISLFKSNANKEEYMERDMEPEHPEVFIKAVDSQRPGLWTLLPDNKWYDILGQKLELLWEGKKTAQEAMDEAKLPIEEAIREGNPEIFDN